jgi:hypothetical protein
MVPSIKKSERLSHKREKMKSLAEQKLEFNRFTAPFLQKTFDLISNCHPDVAGWEPDGESFFVKDQVVFGSEYIPVYFEHNKFQSFSRQLNFYGFKKLPRKVISAEGDGTKTGKSFRFYNQFFKRGRPDLLHRISRSTTKKEASSNSADIEELKDRVHSLEDTFEVTRQTLQEMQNQLYKMMNQRSNNHTFTSFPTKTIPLSSSQLHRVEDEKVDNCDSHLQRVTYTSRQHSLDFSILPDDFEPIKLDYKTLKKKI